MNFSSKEAQHTDNVLAGLVTTDINGCIIKTNSNFLSMVDYSKDDVLDKMYFQDFLSKGSHFYYETYFLPLLKIHGEVKEINLDLKKKGKIITVLVNSTTKKIEGKEYIQTTLFEIRNREKYERELFNEKKKAELLAQKLKEANEELVAKNEIVEKQRNELAELNKQKDKIVGVMSHDFRSPLIELQSLMYLINDCIDELSKEELANMLNQGKDSLSNAVELADNLIEWSLVQLDNPQRNVEPKNLKNIVDDVLPLQLQAAQKKNITLNNSVRPDFKIAVPAGHIALILRNLLTNAIKFTEEGGTITVEGFEESFTNVLIVKDTGMGMKPDLIDRFHNQENIRSSRGTSGEKGFGLGLFLVKDTVRSNKGNIEVTSELNKGTTFKIKFPKNLE